MSRSTLLKTFLFQLFTLYVNFVFAQTNYQFTINKTSEECIKASADIEISGTAPDDTIQIKWSTGETDTRKVNELEAGDYFVSVKIRHRKDSLLIITDTTLNFMIGKGLCPVQVDKYFSPNDDNYHDKLYIGNIQNYPDFELNIFNKWGQKVHTQKKNYTPWDGKWNGIDLPDGAYYYVFFYNSSDKGKLIKGDITILR
jgi:gliding motility-associated-like protein